MINTELSARYAAKASATLCECATVLPAIHHPEIALAVWQRRLPDGLVAELADLVLDAVDDVQFIAEIGALELALDVQMGKAGYPQIPSFSADIVMLARTHATISRERRVSVRLEVVESDACRRFHVDYVKVRTITTYLGPGTQWIVADEAGPAIHELGSGEVGMFKGRLWQQAPAILHRSPPLGGSGTQRLVLVIDGVPADDDPATSLGELCA